MSNKQNSVDTIRQHLSCICYNDKTAEILRCSELGLISCVFRMGTLATFMDSRMGVKKAERLRSDIAVFILEAIDEKLKTYDKQ
jgi:hypothetical protein